MRVSKLIAFAFAVLAGALALLLQPRSGPKVTVAYAAAHNNHDDDGLNDELAEALATAGFTGNIQQIFQQRLEANLGRPIDREQWSYGLELVTIAEWQIRGVIFGVMVSAPSAPIPDEQRGPMGERARADIDYVESLVRKHGLA